MIVFVENGGILVIFNGIYFLIQVIIVEDVKIIKMIFVKVMWFMIFFCNFKLMVKLNFLFKYFKFKIEV